MEATEIERRKGLSGTFALNKFEPIHRWYKYDEGYSSEFIINELRNLPIQVKSIYDPFGGSGTTLLVAAQFGIDSIFSEINPFMAFVTETKINTVRQIQPVKNEVLNELRRLLNLLKDRQISIDNFDLYDGFEKYYKPEVLNQLLSLKAFIKNNFNENSLRILLLGLASITVKVSNMIKRGDLRYAKGKEKKPDDFDVFLQFSSKLEQIIEDIDGFSDSVQSTTFLINNDARKVAIPFEVDCVITSPPYLNGTNYIRNTKLELKLLDFIKTESELPLFHSKGIMAGINSVSNRRTIPFILDEVKEYVEALEPIAYDKRIPVMVAGYFYDMDLVFSRLEKFIKNNGIFIMDIGDSQFAGIHIPTDKILLEIANKHGFKLYDEETLRTRRSKNKMILSQKVLRFQLKK